MSCPINQRKTGYIFYFKWRCIKLETNLGQTSLLANRLNSPVQTKFILLLPPVVSRRGTYSFPVVLHMRRRLGTTCFFPNYF